MSITVRLRIVIIFCSALTFWLLMQLVHESGHVVAAWLTGGRVVKLVWHPLMISRTEVLPNPEAVVVAWGGAIWGSVLPLVLWAVLKAVWGPGVIWVQAFAGFCLIANGAYLSAGIIMPVGDTEDLLRLGVRSWALDVIGVSLVIGGLVMWHRLGAGFGLGAKSPAELRMAAQWSGGLLVGCLMAMLVLGLR